MDPLPREPAARGEAGEAAVEVEPAVDGPADEPAAEAPGGDRMVPGFPRPEHVAELLEHVANVPLGAAVKLSLPMTGGS